MKKLVLSTVIALAPLSFALAASDETHPPKKAMDSATPEMRNPEGTDKMHPPQKAMDEATPTKETSTATPDLPAAGGKAAQFPSWDIRKAGEGVSLSPSKKI